MYSLKQRLLESFVRPSRPGQQPRSTICWSLLLVLCCGRQCIALRGVSEVLTHHLAIVEISCSAKVVGNTWWYATLSFGNMHLSPDTEWADWGDGTWSYRVFQMMEESVIVLVNAIRFEACIPSIGNQAVWSCKFSKNQWFFFRLPVHSKSCECQCFATTQLYVGFNGKKSPFEPCTTPYSLW